MPRPDDLDDYDPPGRSAVPFPTGVKVAGIIWIAFGVLGLIGNLTTMLMNAGQAAQPAPQGPPVAGNLCSFGCGVLFAVVFLMVGIQTVRGTAKGTLGNGIGSLIFAALYLGMAALVGVAGASGQLPPGVDTLMFVMAGFMVLLGLALLAAGVLALMGKSAYEKWLVAHGRGPGPRRRTREEEDYDDEADRPRRPRRDRDDDDDDDRPPRPRRDRDDDDR